MKNEPNSHAISGTDWERNIGASRIRRLSFLTRMSPKIILYKVRNEGFTKMISEEHSTLLKGAMQNVLSSYTDFTHVDCQSFLIGESMLLFTIKTNPDNYAKILGKGAVSLAALKHLFSEIGKTYGWFIQIRLLPASGDHTHALDKPYDEEGTEYDGQPVADTLTMLLALLCQQAVETKWKNVPGATAFSAQIPTPISDLAKQSLARLVDLFGAKARRRFYLEIV